MSRLAQIDLGKIHCIKCDPVSGEATMAKGKREKLMKLQRRRQLLRIAAYRTVSAGAIQVLTSQIPIIRRINEGITAIYQ